MKKSLSILFTLLVSIGAIGCGGTDINEVSGLQGQSPVIVISPTPTPTDSPTPIPDPDTFVRLSNALTSAGGNPEVDVLFNGQLVAEDLAYQEVTDYIEIESTSVSVEVRLANSNDELFSQNVIFQEGEYQTAVLAGSVDLLNPRTNAQTTQQPGVFVFADDVQQVPGKAKYRFVNLAESLSEEFDADQIKMVAYKKDKTEFDLTGFVPLGGSDTQEFDIFDFDGVREVRVVDTQETILGVFTGLRSVPQSGSEQFALYQSWNPTDGVNATFILTDYQSPQDVSPTVASALTLIGVPDDPEAGDLSVLGDSLYR